MPSTNEKINATLLSVIVFLLVSLPSTYKFTNGIFGGELAEPSGCPTLIGLLVHALVFAVIIYILMGVNLVLIK
jgi:ABC-type long-subunit fatty acid transport system fused permease/ATPase subunit